MTVTQKWTLAIVVGTVFAGLTALASVGLPMLWPGCLFMFSVGTCTVRFLLDIDWR